MKKSDNNFYNPPFSHIYIERGVKEHPRTRRILEKFPRAEQIEIQDYKEVFCRRGQSIQGQHQSPSLILSARKGKLIYEGAGVCQSFGNEHFYYTSCVMNCIYHCEYCYLGGMYPSGHIVMFVNLEDIFAQIEDLLQQHPVYLCVSYDTDLMGWEDVTGFVREWSELAASHPGLSLEIRTKCGRKDLWSQLDPEAPVIYAFTMSPEYVIRQYEHRTASLKERIACAAMAQEKGFSVRLCFDPMIYVPDWKRHYQEMLDEIFDRIDMEKVPDISVGSFRISKDYLKKVRRAQPDSAVVWYPFQNEDGVYHYPRELMQEMEQYLVHKLQEKVPVEKIYLWEV